MLIKLITASGRCICRHPQCNKKTEYIERSGRIKKGITCAAITLNVAGARKGTFYYCRDCIDRIYGDVKKLLNPKLWCLT